MRVAIYCRVSTLHQDAGLQLRDLREFCAARSWSVAGEYVDAGVSGAKDRRPELDRLMRDAGRRAFDAVLVWKLDRFARSLKHMVCALSEFESLGVSFVSLKDNLDLTTASGRLTFGIIAVMAEFERSLIQERVRAGLRNARANGKVLGRPRVAADGAAVRDLRAAGRSWSEVSAITGLSVGTAHRAFHKPLVQ